MENSLSVTPVKKLRLTVLDTNPEYRAFAERRGYNALQHLIGMELELKKFDERPYVEIIDALKAKGFQFTSMEGLGNTEEAQRKLYELNDTAASETAGSDGEHPWTSFEDFQKRVCQAGWYIPGGQIVVIELGDGQLGRHERHHPLPGPGLRLQPFYRRELELPRPQAGAGGKGTGTDLCPGCLEGAHGAHAPQF